MSHYEIPTDSLIRNNLHGSDPLLNTPCLLRGVTTIALLHFIEVFLLRLEIKRHRTCKWQERQALLLKLLKSLSSAWLGLVDTVKLNAMARRSDVQIPVPCAADVSGLGLRSVSNVI